MRRILTLSLLALVLTVLAIRSIRDSGERPRTIAKWIFTALVSAFLAGYVWPMAGEGGQTTFSALSLTIFSALAMFITWRQDVLSWLLNPITSLYDGGSLEPELRPLYSIAQAKQKRGQYLEAVAEVEKQLARFPTDFEGQMMLAQIQAGNLRDLAAAGETIQRLCSQPGHSPANLAFALYSLADWQLQYASDQPAARAALEQVIALLPDTEFSLTAAQRIAHLGTPEMFLPAGERHKFIVHQTDRHFGVRSEPRAEPPAESSPAESAAAYVRHLQEHPLDTDAREHLATIYAEHYQRLDLAADQLEQMIQQPNRSLKAVARWLNQLADLQVRSGATYDDVKGTLQRIIDLDPKHSAAEQARKRMGLLKLEIKALQQNDAVKMGAYEQKLGLKRDRPSRP